jgi:hypothetical protein
MKENYRKLRKLISKPTFVVHQIDFQLKPFHSIHGVERVQTHKLILSGESHRVYLQKSSNIVSYPWPWGSSLASFCWSGPILPACMWLFQIALVLHLSLEYDLNFLMPLLVYTTKQTQAIVRASDCPCNILCTRHFIQFVFTGFC